MASWLFASNWYVLGVAEQDFPVPLFGNSCVGSALDSVVCASQCGPMEILACVKY